MIMYQARPELAIQLKIVKRISCKECGIVICIPYEEPRERCSFHNAEKGGHETVTYGEFNRSGDKHRRGIRFKRNSFRISRKAMGPPYSPSR